MNRKMEITHVQGPEGPVECLVVHLFLVVPLTHLRPASRIVDAGGNVRSPVDGMIPILETRAVVPMERLVPPRSRLVVPEGEVC